MNPVRRRKKRPNYGVRTVEVSRGKNGYGFTISGQKPCILSCIVPGSPAEKAGLRAGDYLVAVNGQSVSKVPHDDVVHLIGCSSGVLKLQIAENYYSDSSDEEQIGLNRPKPKYLHKSRGGSQQSQSQQSRAAKVVRDLRTGVMFEEPPLDEISPVALPRQIPKPLAPPPTFQPWVPDVPLPPPPQRIYPFLPAEKQENNSVEYRALVGYLGTIEMPKELQPGSKLQVVRSCIRRLRAEKRAHTLVLMSICTCSLVLTNCHQAPLAEYPADRVTFCGASSDEDRRFFGLVTTAAASSSCHVFAVERRLAGSHADHAAKAEAFNLVCSSDCREFPASSDPIVTAIKTLYARDEPLVANSPQPSHASTTASSNSDSGIGFRDDCGHQSDRILVVDVQNQRLHIQTPQAARVFELRERLTVRAMPDPDLVRLSPKVFPRPSACSLEDLKTHDLDSSPPPPPPVHNHTPHWGSLQELRSFVANCFEHSPGTHNAVSILFFISPIIVFI